MNKKKYGTLLILLAIFVMCYFLIKWAAIKVYPLKHVDIIKRYSSEYNIDEYLVAALIKTESNFNNQAVSHKNANGLMQITDDTAAWIAVKIGINNFDKTMLYDPEINIKMGCWYLDDLRSEFGDIQLVLAAYNGGRGNVKKWLENNAYSSDGERLDYIPFKETDQYVKKVETNYNIYKFLYKDVFK